MLNGDSICPSQNESLKADQLLLGLLCADPPRMSAILVYLGMVGMVDLRVCSCPGPRRPPHLGIGDPASVTFRMKATAQANEENS